MAVLAGSFVPIVAAIRKVAQMAQWPMVQELWWRSEINGDRAAFVKVIESETMWQLAREALTASLVAIQAAIVGLGLSYEKFERLLHGGYLTEFNWKRPRSEHTLPIMRMLLPYIFMLPASHLASRKILHMVLKRKLKALNLSTRPFDASAEADLAEIEAAGHERTRHGVGWSEEASHPVLVESKQRINRRKAPHDQSR